MVFISKKKFILHSSIKLQLKIARMLGVTGPFSDSQESALMDDETYKVLEKETCDLPAPDDGDLLDISEQKVELTQANCSLSQEKKQAIKRHLEDDEEEYYALLPQFYNNPFDCSVNFQFTFGDSGGQDWAYSSKSNRLFIKMEKTLPLRFTWDTFTSGLFLRTELVYTFDEYKNDPVRRCLNHVSMENYVNQTMNPDRIRHVVHCVNHADSIYLEENEHLSVLTPLGAPEAGSQYVPMCFKFFCKNSCPSGMNRRATELLFTLEDSRRQIIARQTLAIKICSCPKRDKQKSEVEEERVSRELSLTNTTAPDKHSYKVELEIIGKENCLKVYKYAYDVMAGQAIKTGQMELYKPSMDKILQKIPP